MHLLYKGIELAKDLQMAIVRVGVSLIEKKEIKKGNTFRYCILENSYLKDIGLFQYPLALQKLALFIMSAYKSKFAKSKPMPLVISVKNMSQKTTLVVAVTGATRSDTETTRNNFGTKFNTAA